MTIKKVIPAHELLSTWISSRPNFNQSTLALRLDVSRTSVTHWCKGKSPPNRTRAAKIERMSKGLVPADLWPQRRKTGATVGAVKMRDKMDDLNIGPSEAARRCDTPQSTLVHILNGTTPPSQKSIDKINAGLKLTLTVPMFRRAA